MMMRHLVVLALLIAVCASQGFPLLNLGGASCASSSGAPGCQNVYTEEDAFLTENFDERDETLQFDLTVPFEIDRVRIYAAPNTCYGLHDVTVQLVDEFYGELDTDFGIDEIGGGTENFRSGVYNEYPVIDAGTNVVGEADVLQGLDASDWVQVTFQNTLNNPAVVATLLTTNDSSEAFVRIKSVTNTGFQLKIVNWDGQAHGTDEDVSWVAVSAGTHYLVDGTRITAGTQVDVSRTQLVTFGQSFGGAVPYVFAQIVSEAREEPVIVRASSGPTTTGFTSRLQAGGASGSEEESYHPESGEDVAYLAFLPSECEDAAFFVKVNDVTHRDKTASRSPAPVADPVFLYFEGDYNGGDTSIIRGKSYSPTSVTFFVEESDNHNPAHTETVVNIAAIPHGLLEVAAQDYIDVVVDPAELGSFLRIQQSADHGRRLGVGELQVFGRFNERDFSCARDQTCEHICYELQYGGCSSCEAPELEGLCNWCVNEDNNAAGVCLPATGPRAVCGKENTRFRNFIKGSDKCDPEDPLKTIRLRGSSISPQAADAPLRAFGSGFCKFPTEPWIIDRWSALPFLASPRKDEDIMCGVTNSNMGAVKYQNGETEEYLAFDTKEAFLIQVAELCPSLRNPFATPMGQQCVKMMQNAWCTSGCPEYGASTARPCFDWDELMRLCAPWVDTEYELDLLNPVPANNGCPLDPQNLPRAAANSIACTKDFTVPRSGLFDSIFTASVDEPENIFDFPEGVQVE